MFWQDEYIREGESMTLNDTYRLDLPEHGLLGSLYFRLSGDEKSAQGQDSDNWRIIDYISKVEIIGNGSTVIKSLTGLQLQACATFDQHVMPPSVWRNYASNTQFEFMLMNFGLSLGDVDHGLDLSQYDSVELRITNTATSTYFSGLAVTVMGHYLRDANAGQFKGHMRTESWRTWTTVADETKYLTLPVEHVIRRILLEALPDLDSNHLQETNMVNLMYDIDLTFQTGQVKVFKGGLDDLIRMNYFANRAPFIAVGWPYMLADDGINMSLGYVHGAVAGAGAQDGAVANSIPTIESALSTGTQKPETYDGDHPIGLWAMGSGPFNCGLFDFAVSPDPSTWLDPDRQKNVLLNIQTRNAASAADGSNSVILDRLVVP